MGNQCLSLQDYNQAIDLDPNDVYAYYNRGALHLIMENTNSAVLDFIKAIELDPLDESTYSYRGLIYQKMGDMNLALLDYDKAIELNPKNPLAYYQRGVLQSEIGNKDQAIIDYNTSIALDPNNSNVYTNRGALLKELNQNDKAFQDYNKALELDSNNLFALANLGDLYYIRQNYTLSFDQYYRVLNLLIIIKSQQINQLNLQEWHFLIIQEKFKLLREIQESAVQLRLELQKPCQPNYDQSINDIKKQFRCLERKIKKQLKPQTQFSKLEEKQQEFLELLLTKEEMISLYKQVAQLLQIITQQNPITAQIEEEAKLKRMDDQFIEEKLSVLHKVENNHQLIYYNALFQSLCCYLQVILQIQQELSQINNDLLIENQSKILEGIIEQIVTLKSKIEIDRERFDLINQALDNMIYCDKKNKIQIRLHRLTNIFKCWNTTNLFELEKELKIAIIELAIQQQKDLQEENNSQLSEFITKLGTTKYHKEQNVHQHNGIHDALIIIKYLEDMSVSINEMNEIRLRVLILEAIEKNKKLKGQIQQTEKPIIQDSLVIDSNSSCQCSKIFCQIQ